MSGVVPFHTATSGGLVNQTSTTWTTIQQCNNPTDIKVTDNLNKILSYYIQQNNPYGYIFPIIHSDIPAQQDKNIQWARSRYNRKLKLLAKMCGIEENLTGYVSRHSFATQAMLQEVPLNAISSMLGHSSLKTTEVYLKGLPTNILDEYNERILQMN